MSWLKMANEYERNGTGEAYLIYQRSMLPITRVVFNRRPSFFSLKSFPSHPAPCTTCRSTVAMIGIIYLFFWVSWKFENVCSRGQVFFAEEWVCRLAFINIIYDRWCRCEVTVYVLMYKRYLHIYKLLYKCEKCEEYSQRFSPHFNRISLLNYFELLP